MNQLAIRNRSLNIINNLPIYSVNKDESIEALNRPSKVTKRFLKNNQNLIFTLVQTRATLVALNKDKYAEIKNLLSDSGTYIIANRNPVKK